MVVDFRSLDPEKLLFIFPLYFFVCVCVSSAARNTCCVIIEPQIWTIIFIEAEHRNGTVKYSVDRLSSAQENKRMNDLSGFRMGNV